MNEGKFIYESCSIGGQMVRKNGEIIFHDPVSKTSAFLISIYEHFEFDYPRFFKMDDLSKLGWLASEILLKGQDGIRNCNPEKIGVVLSNANSSIDTDLKYFDSLSDTPSPSLFVYTLPNIMIAEICIRNNFKGEGVFFISERFDEKFMAGYVNKLLDSGKLEFCICGWVELFQGAFQAVLFLVGNSPGKGGQLFSADQMIEIFKIQ